MRDLNKKLEITDERTRINNKAYVPESLMKSDFVQLRIDRVRKPLEGAYSDPHKVLIRRSKFSTFVTRIDSYKRIKWPFETGEFINQKVQPSKG